MNDRQLNDRLVIFLERDVFGTINIDVILAYFQEINDGDFHFKSYALLNIIIVFLV
jgi:hypothetical protein